MRPSSSSSSLIWQENSQPLIAPPPPPSSTVAVADHNNSNCINVLQLLARREVSPCTKHYSKRFWGENTSTCNEDSDRIKGEATKDARQGLISWVEAESMRHLSAKYCPLFPPPRSTIAAAFSPDGKTLASTHGDHTVKIIDWQTGKCLKVLSGHRRTPWVVRFHPLHEDVLASGSLDHEVRLWNAKSAECIGSLDFYRPIASIAFHAQGEYLAVASGHKLYIWHYNRKGESSAPAIILRTRRSLRAVHFHPYAAPFLLTAEVNDLDSSDSSMTLATSQGYLHYPPPTVYIADARSNSTNDLPVVTLPFIIWPPIGRIDEEQRMDPSASVRLLTYSTPSGQYELLLSPIDPNGQEEPVVVDLMETNEERNNQFFPFSDPAYWDLPLMQGWLIGQSQRNRASSNTVENHSIRQRSSRTRSTPVPVPSSNINSNETLPNFHEAQPFATRIQSEIATSLAAAAAAELPCTVKLKIWTHDLDDPCALLDAQKCRLIIPHAVLCSEMGAHFSPCGRFLAACVACVLPNMEGDHLIIHQDGTGASTSPTRHPISAHHVMYELRIYSLEESTFGSVLASRAIRAAHCLTSIQFSPSSEHLLLAYGRRHNSLLKSVVIDGDTTIPIYTILEVYRVSDMELVRVLPSAEDEVNVACFHPSVGNGLVYGTKEGKLRILQYDNSATETHILNSLSHENMLESPTYALQG